MRSSLEKLLLGNDTSLSSALGLKPPSPPQPPRAPPSPYQPPPTFALPSSGHASMFQQPFLHNNAPPFQQPQLPYRTPSPQPAAVPWLLITPNEVRSSRTNTALFTIAKASSTTTITRATTNTILGTIRFHSSTGTIDLNINGHETKIKDSSGMGSTFNFHPTVSPGTKWFWRTKSDAFTLHEGDKEGRVLARIDGNTLVCEPLGFPEPVVDEILASAVAVLLKKKKLGKQAEGIEAVAEVLGAIGGA